MELKPVCGVIDRRWYILLIVPYGIETYRPYFGRPPALAFNCTLWNWNREKANIVLCGLIF